MTVTWEENSLRWQVSVVEAYGSRCVEMQTHRLMRGGVGLQHSVEIPARIARQLSLALYEMSLAAEEEPDE
jgi:hypothetical protein